MSSSESIYQDTNWINDDIDWTAFDVDWSNDLGEASLSSSTDNPGVLDEIQFTIPTIDNNTFVNDHQVPEQDFIEEGLLPNPFLQQDQNTFPDPSFLLYENSHETQGNDHQYSGLTIDPSLLLPDRSESTTDVSTSPLSSDVHIDPSTDIDLNNEALYFNLNGVETIADAVNAFKASEVDFTAHSVPRTAPHQVEYRQYPQQSQVTMSQGSKPTVSGTPQPALVRGSTQHFLSTVLNDYHPPSQAAVPQGSKPAILEAAPPALVRGSTQHFLSTVLNDYHTQSQAAVSQGSKPTGVSKRSAPKRKWKGQHTTPSSSVNATHQHEGRRVQSYACDNCRRSKQSCGGDGTNPCERCQEKGRTCIYSHIDNRTVNSTLAVLSQKHNQLLIESCELLTVLNLVRPRFRETKSGQTAATLWSARKPPTSIFDALMLVDENVLHMVTMPRFAKLDTVVRDARKGDLRAIRRALEYLDRKGLALFKSIRDIIDEAIAANRDSYSNTMELFIHDFLHTACEVGQTRAYLNSLVPEREPLAKLAAAESVQSQ